MLYKNKQDITSHQIESLSERGRCTYADMKHKVRKGFNLKNKHGEIDNMRI